MNGENGEQRQQRITLKAFGMEVEIRGLTVMLGFLVLLVVVNSYLIFAHSGNTEKAIDRASRAQRFFACILAQEMDKREAQLKPGSGCHVMSKVEVD